MIRLLITGKNSYIGTHVKAHLQGIAQAFDVCELDVKNGFDDGAFRGFDAVLHVAGIAHQRETAQGAALYFSVNEELALSVARAAKAAGVKQFLFLSSMSVYGLTCGRITASTPPAPTTSYGKSKWAAEQGLTELMDDSFRVAILRPPMIYGRGCKGNYPRLSGLVKRLRCMPRVSNERSMLYIGNLCACVQRLLESGEGGLYFPQNADYVQTDALVREIASANGLRVWQPRGFGWLLGALAPRVGLIGKVFGTLTYDHAMSANCLTEDAPTFAQTIRLTEGTK